MIKYNVIGSGSGFSATYGAAIVLSLAKKLQMPIAVALNSVGNKSLLLKNTKLNVLLVPILPIIMNKGIQLV